jgi:hypothetical protein
LELKKVPKVELSILLIGFYVIFLVIDPVLAPMVKVPYGPRSLLQADLQRRQGPKIPVGKMLQKPSPILPSLPMSKALQIA